MINELWLKRLGWYDGLTAEESSFLIVSCDCGQRMKVPADARGKAVRCVKCGERVEIAAEKTPEPTPLKLDPVVRQFLIEEHFATDQQLADALAATRAGDSLIDRLVGLKVLDPEAFHSAMSQRQGLAGIDLKHYDVEYDILGLVPENVARSLLLIPIDKLGKLLTVGMACPLDETAVEAIRQLTGLRVKAMLCGYADLKAALNRYYGEPKDSTPYRHMATAHSLKLDPKYKPDTTKDSAAAKQESPAAVEERPAPPPPKPEPEPEVAVEPELTPVATAEEVTRLLGKLEVLPAPAAAIESLKALADQGAPAADLARCVAEHPAIAARLFAVANTSAYGMPGRVTSIGIAVALLGAPGLAVLAERVPKAPVDLEHHYDLVAFRARSLYCARAAELAAMATNRAREGVAYAAGLVHEIGQLAMAVVLRERFEPLNTAQVEAAVLADEAHLFGMNHLEAGHLLAERWGLPPQLAEPIRHHREPHEAPNLRDIVQIVGASAILAAAYGRGETDVRAVYRSQVDVFRGAGLDEATVTRIFGEAAKAASADETEA